MIRSRAVIALAATALALGGCVTVFPKSKPAMLYTFGQDFPAPVAPGPAGPSFDVLRSQTSFVAAAEGDRILTTNGQSVAYIADSRWVSPAQVLFDEAEARAFDAHTGPAKLVHRGELAKASYELRLAVVTFEARYAGAAGAAPTVIVEVQASLVSLADHHLAAERTFTAQKPAGDNRVGAIVRAFDAATVDVLSQTAAWTDAQGASATPAGG